MLLHNRRFTVHLVATTRVKHRSVRHRFWQLFTNRKTSPDGCVSMISVQICINGVHWQQPTYWAFKELVSGPPFRPSSSSSLRLHVGAYHHLTYTLLCFQTPSSPSTPWAFCTVTSCSNRQALRPTRTTRESCRSRRLVRTTPMTRTTTCH